MGCNCGDNEYNIEIENNGSCEPTTPIYNITLANVGVDGFSPLVEFVDVTSASFRIQTTDKNGINISEPIPLSNYIESNFAKLSSANTFTANNTFDGLVFFNNTVYTDRLYSRTPTSPLIIGGNSSTITLGANSTIANYHGSEIATVDQIPDTSSFVTIDTTQTITGTKTFSNNISIQANSGGAGSVLGVGENYAVGLLGFTTSGTIQVGSSSSELYFNGALDRPSYNGTELALRSDIPSLNGYATEAWVGQQGYLTSSDLPTVGNGTITLTQGGVTKGTFTTNQSGNTTIDLDAGGAITNPLVIKNADKSREIRLGINTSTNKAEMSYALIGSAGSLAFPIKLIGDVNNPLVLIDLGYGTNILTLNYNTDTLELTNDNKLTVKEMTGCDSITGGTSGLVPAPSAGDENKFLKADGTWDTVGGGSSYTAGTGIDITNNVIEVDSTVERTTNKVTALSADLTDTQYPSAKLFFDTVTALTRVIFQLDSRITALENNINGGNA